MRFIITINHSILYNKTRRLSRRLLGLLISQAMEAKTTSVVRTFYCLFKKMRRWFTYTTYILDNRSYEYAFPYLLVWMVGSQACLNQFRFNVLWWDEISHFQNLPAWELVRKQLNQLIYEWGLLCRSPIITFLHNYQAEWFQCIFTIGKDLTPVHVANDVGVALDSYLSYDEHIIDTVASCMSNLAQINRVKHVFDRKTLLTIMFGQIQPPPIFFIPEKLFLRSE